MPETKDQPEARAETAPEPPETQPRGNVHSEPEEAELEAPPPPPPLPF